MSSWDLAVTLDRVYHNARITEYPDGSRRVLVSDRAIFREPGWETARRPLKGPDGPWLGAEAEYGIAERMGKLMECSDFQADQASREAERAAENLRRSQRRARNAVRDYALSNDFRWFVTLTLDRQRVDRYDVGEIVKKLRTWADNAVRRDGLAYVLVPERHKDGAIHFHGFFNDALPAVDSGTLTDGGKPRRPRTPAERAQLLAQGWREVYNLPRWSLGFSTAIELYGERRKAVAYVEKYITKQAEGGKIGGRWYYSGGDLRKPSTRYTTIDPSEVSDLPDTYAGHIDDLGARLWVRWEDNHGRTEDRTEDRGN